MSLSRVMTMQRELIQERTLSFGGWGEGLGDWRLDTATRNTVQLKLTQLGLANRLTFILNTLDIKFKLKL